MGIILAIDPGPVNSAFVLYYAPDKAIRAREIASNDLLLQILERGDVSADHLAIEMIASYGMPVGASTFDTCVWIGRFIQAWRRPFTKVYRKDVKMHLCGSMRAKDGNVRQALIDMFPATGGGKVPQIGTKKHPGPLYGVRKDIWSALAVAVTYAARRQG